MNPVVDLKPARAHARRIIAVGGGKGGVGKTMVSANLGIALAQAGQRVVMVDVDLGGANLHTCLGVSNPQLTLSDFIHRGAGRLEDVMVPSGVKNLSLVAGALDVLDAANPKYQHKVKLLRGIQSLDADYVLLDLGAGTGSNVLDFFLVADHGVLVVLPEPTSIENAYRFVKAAFFRKLQGLPSQQGAADWIQDAMSTRQGALATPSDFVNQVKAKHAVLGERLEQELESFRVQLVVNQVRSAQDRQVASAVVTAWKKFFGLHLDVLGAVDYDDEAWKALRKKRPVLLERADSAAARALSSAAHNLLALDGRTGSPP